ncbi:hypothetical protein CPC08DRAFT_681314 [Agrocybe pediades]|nr:hypothetical protein CPC08DRAFT_681314 [Agrocybe pediades]
MSSSTSSPNHAITSNPNANASRPRRGHRRRISALRLSTDTTTSLPEYISADAGWSNHQHQYHHGKTSSSPKDRPPDYPDSAEEADEDTDTDNTNVVYVPQPTHANPPPASPYLRPQTTSPRRSKKFFPTHKRRNYSVQAEQSDPYLDSLLERSVHALEMSNTLLQSSISTQSSLSTILASDSRADSYLEARAVGLSSRIRDTWDAKVTWANDLEEISRDVEGLFLERSGNVSPTPISAHPAARARLSLEAGSTSCSLPNTSPLNTMPRSLKVRRPSLELRQSTEPAGAVPRLHYSQQSRSNLVSPPPRPLTQYVASSQDAESILLPSTVGIRSPAPSQPTPDWRPISNLASASSSTTSLLLNHAQSQPSTLPPQLTDKPLEPSTPAYNMLSSFVYRPAQTNGSSGSATPSTSYTPSFRARRRDSSNASNESSRNRRSSASSGTTPKRGVSPSSSGIRPMTPTIEIEEQSSSSSSDGPVAKLTVQSLRKILDDQPTVPASSAASSTAAVNKLRAPAFMPRSPAPLPEASTSNATASISRLFTKGKHSSSTRAASPPRQSAMKRPSAPSSVVHSPAASLIPELVTKMLSKSTGHSPSSSGQSTPSSAKRISFAELPESYASTRPPSSRFTKGNKGKKKGGSKGKGKADSDDVNPSSWWTGWLGPANYGGTSGMHGLGMSFERHEERLEDRQTRNWAGRMNAGYGGGLDEWAV